MAGAERHRRRAERAADCDCLRLHARSSAWCFVCVLTEQISVGAQGSVWTGKIKDLQVVLKILGHGQSSEFFNTEYAAVCVAIIASGCAPPWAVSFVPVVAVGQAC